MGGEKKGNAIMICCRVISVVFLSSVLISSAYHTRAPIFNAIILKITTFVATSALLSVIPPAFETNICRGREPRAGPRSHGGVLLTARLLANKEEQRSEGRGEKEVKDDRLLRA